MGADSPVTKHQGSRWASVVGLGMLAVLVAGIGLAMAGARRPERYVVSPPSIRPSATVTPATSPPPTRGPVTGLGFSVVDDPAMHRVVLFGGVDGSDKTWLWDGERWTSRAPASSPPSRSAAAAAYDPASHEVMLYGGEGPLPTAQMFNDTWAWNGAMWRRLDSGLNGPPAGGGAQMAWDNTRNEMVLVTYNRTLTSAETWTWTGSRWARQMLGNLTAVVFGAVMTYDPESKAVLLISPAISDNAHSVAAEWDGSTWRVLVSVGPAVDGVALDSQVNGLVGCGSTTYSAAFAVQASCWQWTGTGWLPLQEAVAPTAAGATIAAEIDDVDHSQLLMFGWLAPNVQGTSQPVRVWAWDGVSWMLLA